MLVQALPFSDTILQRLEGYWDNHATFNLKGSFEMKKE